jgi:hypothetical protein
MKCSWLNFDGRKTIFPPLASHKNSLRIQSVKKGLVRDLPYTGWTIVVGVTSKSSAV